MATFAIVKDKTVENIAEADSLEILQLLLPEATIIAETEKTGFAWVGAKVIDGRFKAPRPYDSWTYDAKENVWVPPVPQPNAPSYWDEESLSWVELTLIEPEVTDGGN